MKFPGVVNKRERAILDLENALLEPAVAFLHKLKGFSIKEKAEMLIEVMEINLKEWDSDAEPWLEECFEKHHGD